MVSIQSGRSRLSLTSLIRRWRCSGSSFKTWTRSAILTFSVKRRFHSAASDQVGGLSWHNWTRYLSSSVSIMICKLMLLLLLVNQSWCHARVTASFSLRLCVILMRSSGLYPVDRSNQPRNVNRWRPLALLPSTLPVKDRYSSFPFPTTCTTKRICLVTIVSISCRLVLARRSTYSLLLVLHFILFNFFRSY